jgi:hypothetical protein
VDYQGLERLFCKVERAPAGGNNANASKAAPSGFRVLLNAKISQNVGILLANLKMKPEEASACVIEGEGCISWWNCTPLFLAGIKQSMEGRISDCLFGHLVST